VQAGGHAERILAADRDQAVELLERSAHRLEAALDELAEIDADLANIVDLKFFCGFGVAEIAAMHGVSERTVQRQWEKARLLLFRALAERP